MSRRYLKMIRHIRVTSVEQRDWAVYVVRCADGSLYTGATKNVEQRVAKHNGGNGAAYTRARRPVRLLYHEDGMTRSEALVREARIKALPKIAKERLVAAKPRRSCLAGRKRATIAAK